MIPTTRLGLPYRQHTHDLCGIAAYATAVRPFCGKGLNEFLHDFWKRNSDTIKLPNEQGLAEFYENSATNLFNAFPWDGTGNKMFKWIRSLEGPSFHYAGINCSFKFFALPEFNALEVFLRQHPTVACIATGFDAGKTPVSHVVNVWFGEDEQTFCLRDSDRSGLDLVDGTAPSLIHAIELIGIRQKRNGQILQGMAVTQK